MANASEIADLIALGMKPPAGTQDVSEHVGIVKTWDPLSGVNTVEVNGTTLSNLSSLQNGMGNAFFPGDVVAIRRVQTKYYILGRIAAPNGLTGSQPQSLTEDGGTISGSQNVWKDLDAGPGVSPRITVRIGNAALIRFGIGTLATNNSEIDCTIAWSGASTTNPDDNFTGFYFTSGSNNNQNGGPTMIQSPSKDMMVYRNTGIRELPGGGYEFFVPGVYTFFLKYQWRAYNNGNGAQVINPWLTVIPF
ncbi:hypothetical protein [Amycolatopsis sp. FDAARGOS 1241]|uniref:hypothetical protein n=1 Tax=Amycolatopsis sp. FDAARGOS 1241 TaxID=2778070 RepID=UPI00195041D7|nr:hypothetical protein [Amycolatopsis sp. FDAARGOS 1241]QRP48977.1 hypothetical protein I6J71_14930 [Amycolatopsis sp. FDAARGOS 1241]